MATRYTERSTITVGGAHYTIFPFTRLEGEFDVMRLPYSLRILLENLLRHGDQPYVTDDDIRALAGWDPAAAPAQEIAFMPARVLLQDFTGVPAIVDLAAMRDAMVDLGGDPKRINPLSPVELVIDHSVMVDHFGSASALTQNTHLEVERNVERYKFLRWGQQAFDNFKVVPPGTGIVHQVNLEYLARGVFTAPDGSGVCAYPDTVVGTDSHTTMVNGMGVLGWGVGGIEAEAAMLGQPVTMLIPQVVGFRLEGVLPEGATATDLVLTVTEMLRRHGVVGKFVEFYGPGIASLSLADRATIANMAPEYGATCGIFPMDRETLRYLRLTGRSEAAVKLVETYLRAMNLWHDENTAEAVYSSTLELDLGTVVPSIAGPKRPQDRIALADAKGSFEQALLEHESVARVAASAGTQEGDAVALEHGAVVIAAITSCTNTSNPAVLIAAGLLARNARRRGLATRPWVKTSLAPGSKVVTEYLQKSGLMEDLEALGFYLVGYGCTTCIGNSGPLPEEISAAIRRDNLFVASLLSGNRNFEGRIHPEVRANYLASPPLVVAYALAGNLGIDLTRDPIGEDRDGRPVTLKEIWPTSREIRDVIEATITRAMFEQKYADVYSGNENWNRLPVAEGERYDWPNSTYVRRPPFFEGITRDEPPVAAIEAGRCLVMVADSVTTDHISPAGSIAAESPAGTYLQELQIGPAQFNSYGSRRGNHEIMMRGTFANVRLRNQLAPGTEGSWTTHWPTGEVVPVFEASERYRRDNTPLVILAGKEYGTGSSRDWAAKGPSLLGVRAVIAGSFERIHRSNLIGMGVLPLQYAQDDAAAALGLVGDEVFTIPAVAEGQRTVEVVAEKPSGESTRFEVTIRIDTPNEFAYYRSGGILQYVLRRLTAS